VPHPVSLSPAAHHVQRPGRFAAGRQPVARVEVRIDVVTSIVLIVETPS